MSDPSSQSPQSLTEEEPLAIEQWARGMADLATAIAEVVTYECETLHKAANQGIEDAGLTLAAALAPNRKNQEDQR